MKLDIDKTISELQQLNDDFEHPFKQIERALDVCKMWKWFRNAFSEYPMTYGCMGETTIRRIINEAEDKYFSLFVGASYKIKIEGTSMDKVRSTIDYIQSIRGVKEVRNVVE